MTTTAPTSQSPDRMAQVHKANQPKSGQPTPSTPTNDFAALLMLLDTDPVVDVGQLLPSERESAATTPLEDDTVAQPSPGQLALQGLMNWMAGGVATSTPNTQLTDGTSKLAGTSPSFTYTRPAGEMNAPLVPPGPGQPQLGTNSDTGLPQPTDEALPAEMLAALRAASPDAAEASASKSNTAPRGGAAIGMADAPPGAKAKPGTLRHALSTGQSTPVASASAPSTVSLALRGMPVDAANPTSTQLSVGAKTAHVTDTSASGREPTTPATESAGTPVAGARAQEIGAGPTTPLFASAMDAAGTDATPMPPPDVPGMPTPESMEQTMEQLGAHIAYWATQGNQRASLTIGDSQNNPLGVNISFENGEVHVHFETDEAEVKEALSLSAEDMLNHMLEAKGLALGDVSIGAGQGGQQPTPQGNANQPHGSDQRPTDNPSALAARSGNATRQAGAASVPVGRPADVISASKLDFFA